jgi:CheY-like chemotaxis protein
VLSVKSACANWLQLGICWEQRFEQEMGIERFPAITLARHELEETWRLRLEQCQQRYLTATTEYRRLLQEEPDGRPPSPDSALARARQAESETLKEYSRLLQIFTDLTLHGKLPDEAAAACSDRSYGKDGTMISVVDDDESIRDSTKTLLRSAGYQVVTFASAELFWDSGAIHETECIILDVRMPGMDGLELQQRLNASHAGVPIIFVTAHDDAGSRRLAIEAGAVDFLIKPFEASALMTTVDTALTRRNVHRRE